MNKAMKKGALAALMAAAACLITPLGAEEMSHAGVPQVLALSEPATPATGPVDPSSYPMLGDLELGQLRWFLMIAEQPLSDFTHLEGRNQKDDSAYRYSIAFMTYFLALEQYHKLPASPAPIQKAMDRLIQKIITRPVWEYWAEVSRGVPKLEPYLNQPYPERHDPVGDENIMYSGHLGHMIGLYEMLFRDFTWDRPNSIVFAWSDTERYSYDHHSLEQAMWNQMKNNPWHSIVCEPNAVFPECNQHPVLSFLLHDAAHGTQLFAVKDQFLDSFLKLKLLDPHSHHMAGFYLVKQNLTVGGGLGLNSPAADGWAGTFMHVWQPEFIARHYPYQRRDHLINWGRDQAWLDPDVVAPSALKYGFFAMLASEMGDAETRDKLLRAAESKYHPVWEGRAYHYPHYPLESHQEVSALSGALLAIARANPPSGFLVLHNRPLDDTHFREPSLTGVDWPKLVLRRAIYDRAKQALVFTTEPGGEDHSSSSLRVINLKPSLSYRLSIDGKPQKEITGVDSIEFAIPLDSRHDFVLQAEE